MLERTQSPLGSDKFEQAEKAMGRLARALGAGFTPVFSISAQPAPSRIWFAGSGDSDSAV